MPTISCNPSKSNTLEPKETQRVTFRWGLQTRQTSTHYLQALVLQKNDITVLFGTQCPAGHTTSDIAVDTSSKSLSNFKWNRTQVQNHTNYFWLLPIPLPDSKCCRIKIVLIIPLNCSSNYFLLCSSMTRCNGNKLAQLLKKHEQHLNLHRKKFDTFDFQSPFTSSLVFLNFIDSHHLRVTSA